MTFVDTYRSETRATLVGMTSLVAVAAVDVVAGRSCALSVAVTTHDVAEAAERRTAVRAHEVVHVPAQFLRFDTLVTEDYLHHHHHTVIITDANIKERGDMTAVVVY